MTNERCTELNHPAKHNLFNQIQAGKDTVHHVGFHLASSASESEAVFFPSKNTARAPRIKSDLWRDNTA